MKVLVVIASDRFNDNEYSITTEVLRNSGVAFDVASTKKGVCFGQIGIEAEADLDLSSVNSDDYDGIVIIGGVGSQDELWMSERLIGIVSEMYASDALISAICLSPVVLALAGILEGRMVTVFPSPASLAAMNKVGANVVDMPVVADLNIVTGRDPGASKEFAEMVVEKLGC
jgi:protease I